MQRLEHDSAPEMVTIQRTVNILRDDQWPAYENLEKPIGEYACSLFSEVFCRARTNPLIEIYAHRAYRVSLPRFDCALTSHL